MKIVSFLLLVNTIYKWYNTSALRQIIQQKGSTDENDQKKYCTRAGVVDACDDLLYWLGKRNPNRGYGHGRLGNRRSDGEFWYGRKHE